jgi:hypothetical protein
MAKATQNFKLFNLMKAGGTVSKEVIAQELGVDLVSVPVYIHELKKQFKAEIESVRDGRKVVGYKLLDKNLDVPQFRKNSSGNAPVKKPVVPLDGDGSVPVLDADADITENTDRDLNDLSDMLGIGNGGRGHGSDE